MQVLEVEQAQSKKEKKKDSLVKHLPEQVEADKEISFVTQMKV